MLSRGPLMAQTMPLSVAGTLSSGLILPHLLDLLGFGLLPEPLGLLLEDLGLLLELLGVLSESVGLDSLSEFLGLSSLPLPISILDQS